MNFWNIKTNCPCKYGITRESGISDYDLCSATNKSCEEYTCPFIYWLKIMEDKNEYFK